MKTCTCCGREFRGFSIKCPYCGCVNYDPTIYPNKVAASLARPVTIGSFTLPVTNLLWIFTINLVILSCVGNAIVCGVTDCKAIWCQYVVAALFSMHIILHAFFSRKPHVMRITRHISYAIMITLLIQMIQTAPAVDAIFLFMVFPLLLLAVNLAGCAFILTNQCSSFSYMITLSINTTLSGILAIVMNYAQAVTVPQIIISYICLGVSALLLANFVMLRVISWISKIKHGY